MLENNEIWKDCKGYEGRYQISNMGRIWSIVSQRYLKGNIDTDGYIDVKLTAKNGKVKKERVHRLVALAFLPNPTGLPMVNHKDENKQNNCVDNLEWCDNKYNANYSLAKAVYCVELDRVFESQSIAAKELGLRQGNISSCLAGRLQTTGGYHWQWVS